ncbi:MAG: glycogen/starch/alpha-glucan phosphorylase [Desulfurococcaceae archaeon]
MVIVSITPEIALDYSRNYAGGLGVLEGDKFYGAGDIGLDYLVLSLLYRHGYVSIDFNVNGDLLYSTERHEKEFMERLFPEEEFTIRLKNTDIYVRPWVYRYKSAKAVLFEAVYPQWARSLTERVYLENSMEEKFLKYALLAKSSAYYLNNVVGIENVIAIDLEESYTSLVLYLLKDLNAKTRIIIHTPGPWGHPTFPCELVQREFDEKCQGEINMTFMSLEKLKNAIVVSRKHKEIMEIIFPQFKDSFKPITNGIYIKRWMHPKLYKAFIENNISTKVIYEARNEAKDALYSLIKKYKENICSNKEKMVIAWARRFTKYKRPYFVFRFIEEHPDLDAIFVVAGKPHPSDIDGYTYSKKARELSLKISNFIYLNNYSLEIAKILVQGSDLWLFTSFSGWEACGTSYMKALVNGVPVLSSRDGGALEIIREDHNGWFFGENRKEFIDIYSDPKFHEIDKKEYVEFRDKLLKIIDLYYTDPERYLEISLNAYRDTPQAVDITNVLKKYYVLDNK